jgi:hypothetical protein
MLQEQLSISYNLSSTQQYTVERGRLPPVAITTMCTSRKRVKHFVFKTKRLEGKISCTEFFKRVTVSGTVADCCELVIVVLTSVFFITIIIASAMNENLKPNS